MTARRLPIEAPWRERVASPTVMFAIGTVVLSLLVIGLFQLNWTNVVGLWGPTAVLVGASVMVARVIRSTAAISDIPGMAKLLVAGLIVKIVGTYGRYLIVTEVYGTGDEAMYYETGHVLGGFIRDGMWTVQGTPIEPFSAGTQAIGWIAGVLFSVTGANRVMGYGFFSLLSWFGAIMFYRAFRLAAPKASSKPFALCIFFLPSLTFWPSSIGKEAFMMCMLGLAALGTVRVLVPMKVGRSIMMVVVGVAGVSWVRPHMAMIFLGAALVGLMVVRPGDGSSQSRMIRGLVLILMVPALFVGLGRMEQMFGEYSGSWMEAGSTMTQDRTLQGGSAFVGESVESPLDLPAAAFSVVLRPLPWQAQGMTSLVASFESLILLGLGIWNWKALVRWLRMAPRHPVVAMCTAYCLLFVIAFSNVGNAGILARQRTQMLPFLLMAVCIAADSLKTAPKPQVEYVRDDAGWAVTTKISDASPVLDARPS